MIRLLTAIILGIFLASNVYAAQNHTVYLVRHAEKEPNQGNPSLTRCGLVRSYQLATLLEEAKIEAIYSTSTLRTMATANPVASNQKIVIENYAPDKLMPLALKVRESVKNSLIVGHSNTTPALVEVLTGQTVEPMSDNDYQYLYQIQFIDGQTYLTTLKQPLTCN